MKIDEETNQAIEHLRNCYIDGSIGLPENLFLLISSLIPIPNVDLLIINKSGEILLSRRNDQFFEKSWHIPGGCMRFRDSFEKCIQETSLREIGCEVRFNPNPIAIRNVIRKDTNEKRDKRERGHNVAILFECTIPDDFEIDNKDLNEMDNGYLKWFKKIPKDFMKIQYAYEDVLTKWM